MLIINYFMTVSNWCATVIKAAVEKCRKYKKPGYNLFIMKTPAKDFQ